MFDFDPKELLDPRKWTPSALIIVAGNFIAILVALIQGMDPSSVVWAYWLESVIIGFYTVLTFGAISVNSIFKRQKKEALGSAGMGAFFTVHYGMFHAGYFVFLYVLPWFTPNPAEFGNIAMLAGIFLVSHAYSFVKNFLTNPKRLEATNKNLSDVMQAPYGRIIPMHVAIILSGFLIAPLVSVFLLVEELVGNLGAVAYAGKLGGLLVFMALKTLADVVGHLMRYRK